MQINDNKKYNKHDAMNAYLQKTISINQDEDKDIIMLLAENCRMFSHEVLMDKKSYQDGAYFEAILTRMIFEYPGKLKCIPMLHKCAIVISDITLSSFLFSFFVGHYINSEDDYIEFLALIVNHSHTYYVKKIKELEHSWDIINLDDGTDKEIVKNLKILISPIRGTLYNNIIEITHELMSENIRPFFNIGTIPIHEYNLYRMLHLSIETLYDRFGLENVLKTMIKDGFNIAQGLSQIDDYIVDRPYKIEQNIIVKQVILNVLEKQLKI